VIAHGHERGPHLEQNMRARQIRGIFPCKATSLLGLAQQDLTSRQCAALSVGLEQTDLAEHGQPKLRPCVQIATRRIAGGGLRSEGSARGTVPKAARGFYCSQSRSPAKC